MYLIYPANSDEFGCIPVNVEFLINYDQLSICLHTHTQIRPTQIMDCEPIQA